MSKPFSRNVRRRLNVERLECRTTPSGVPATWAARGSGGGGALFSPSINPANPNELYVSSDMSDQFRSTDGGATWGVVDWRQLQSGHEAHVQFTEDPLVRYALDHTADLRRPTKSTNGGTTWTRLSSDPTGGDAIYFFADPANQSRLIITDYTNLWFSANGGTSWSLKYTTTNTGAGLLAGGAFFDGTNIYVGTNSGILTSTNGGTSFVLTTPGGIPATKAPIAFAGSKVGTTTRFVTVADDTGDVYAGLPGYDNTNGGLLVYTLDLGQTNWTARALPSSARPFYAAMAAGNINVAYVAGSSDTSAPTVYKTTDGGATWTDVFRTTTNQNIQTGWSGSGGDRGWSYGEMALGFTVANNDPNRLLITDLGFAHLSTDGGATWKNVNVAPADLNPANANTPTGRAYRSSGLDNTTAWQVAWADATTMFVANSDVKGQRSTDAGQSFGFGYTGHDRNSMYRVAVGANGTLYGAAASVHDLYQSTYLTDARIDGGNGAVLFSTNKGATWTTMRDMGANVVWVATDPTNANRVYASVADSVTGGIYVTSNANLGAASTWTKLTNPPRTEGHAFNIVVLNDGTLVVTYSGRRAGTPQNFTASSGVFVSTNGGTSWTDRSDANMPYWTKDVVVDPHDATQNTWWVGVWSGYGGAANDKGGLYKTSNRGQSWTRVIDSTLIQRVTSVTFNPADSNEAFVTTETDGLWYSSNIHAATPTFAQVTSYPFRQPERVFFNPFNASEIWVTSFGNGVRVGSTAAAAPRVSGVAVNAGQANTAQRSRVTSLTVTFNAQVTFAGSVAAGFIVSRINGGSLGGFTASAATVGGVTVVTLNGFTGAETEFGSLADGRYTVLVRASQVVGLDGNGDGTPGDDYTLTGTTANGLFRLFGDVNGDGSVSGGDFGTFRLAFGLTSADPGYLDYLDFDGNGAISGGDFGNFRLRFGTTVP